MIIQTTEPAITQDIGVAAEALEAVEALVVAADTWAADAVDTWVVAMAVDMVVDDNQSNLFKIKEPLRRLFFFV
jgi:hypothetical protein